MMLGHERFKARNLFFSLRPARQNWKTLKYVNGAKRGPFKDTVVNGLNPGVISLVSKV